MTYRVNQKAYSDRPNGIDDLQSHEWFNDSPFVTSVSIVRRHTVPFRGWFIVTAASQEADVSGRRLDVSAIQKRVSPLRQQRTVPTEDSSVGNHVNFR